MSNHMLKSLAVAVTIAGLAATPASHSHLNDKELAQSYRQSWFALVAANFGPMVSTVKGEVPWDQARMQAWSDELATLMSINIMRGFADGTDKGTTRAKPEIWENKADYESKMDKLKEAAAKLQEVTANGDRKAIAQQVGATGKACKSCHDDYRAKEYLY